MRERLGTIQEVGSSGHGTLGSSNLLLPSVNTEFFFIGSPLHSREHAWGWNSLPVIVKELGSGAFWGTNSRLAISISSYNGTFVFFFIKLFATFYNYVLSVCVLCIHVTGLPERPAVRWLKGRLPV